jgi:transposase
MNKTTKSESSEVVSLRVTKKYECIKVSVDWHARQYRVVRIIDNAAPEPAQRFSPSAFLAWMTKQVELAEVVTSCYEAGAGGFVLHRQLTALGVKNILITPRDLDRDHTGVKNDARDAREMAQDLDRYVRGNTKALRVAYVPTVAAEQRRQQSRQRWQLRAHRLSLMAQGRSLLLSQGWHESNHWWKADRWTELGALLPGWLVEALEIFRRLIVATEKEIKAVARKVQAVAPAERPKGLGALGYEELEREVCDWRRFKNRKALGSYTGLVGGVHASDDNIHDLPITKAGNVRLRTMLIELAWRWVFHQRQTPLIQRWSVLLDRTAHRRLRKKAIVAVARQLFIQLWRWQTGRATPEQFGWVMQSAKA